jgi:sulfur relay (sulfurtransferase) complex TusBCD TusD component (DsrE family)
MPVDWKRCALCGKFQSENQAPMKRCGGCYQRRGVSTFYCVGGSEATNARAVTLKGLLT